MERQKFLSAVYIVIIENEKVLLQKRQGTKYWNGYLALPAGHLDEGENVYDAVIREAKEELSIDIEINNIVDTFAVNRTNNGLLPPYFDVYFVIKNYKGTIKINEPNKCLELKWVDVNNLPNDMIDYEKDAIKKWQDNIRFSVINVTNVVLS